MNKIKVGEKYGRLTVLENHHPKDEVVCRCECGNIKIARATNVFYGGTKSCGCLPKEGNNFKHGFRRNGEKSERLYILWKAMRERCNTPSCNCYKNYGARGIKVCPEWDDYMAFKEWALNNGYSDDLSIDRINVNGNYEPSNCRWATIEQQAVNRRNNHYLTINGEKKAIVEWSKASGINGSTILMRLRLGWDEKDAVFTPLGETPNSLACDLEGEEWKQIKKHPRYFVSNKGRIKCGSRLSKLFRKKNTIMVCVDDGNGFHEATVHRLVAEEFIQNPHNYRYVIHKDGDLSNNILENLAWSKNRYKVVTR